ncbi:MAG TPA: glutamine--fructose-6-phosphate aminotransferase, partial [Actinobacteria bacterium]|nr:glutamine--fructose-6-phosphate aminotransferase [Actinomycetota bacterium]
MCGIMGYVGPQQAATVLLDGLRRLEYRGYDSAGIAVANGAIAVLKAEGKIDRLQAVVDAVQPPGTIGIGHTRWATHGAPSDANAHPHTDASGKFVVVHNGIIENHQSLRDELVESGNVFTSETDTEILAHLVADAYDGDLVAAVRSVVDVAEGAYALVVMTEHEPRKSVAVRRVSPMVVGLGDGETFIASDIPAVLHRTKRFLIVEDGEMVVVDDSGVRITTIDGDPVERDVFVVDW